MWLNDLGKFNISFAEGLAPRSGRIFLEIFFFVKNFAGFLRGSAP